MKIQQTIQKTELYLLSHQYQNPSLPRADMNRATPQLAFWLILSLQFPHQQFLELQFKLWHKLRRPPNEEQITKSNNTNETAKLDKI
jgi:hypothetical protein